MNFYNVHAGEEVLFLGEGNFSFCVDFIKLNKHILIKDNSQNLSTSIIATCFESNHNLSEFKKRNINFLTEIGVTILFNIDATRLTDYFVDKKFTKIVFNFPHVGGKMKIHLNRKLLADFFSNAENVLAEDGVVLVTLCDGQGGTDADKTKRRWDDTWKVVELASEANFALKNVHPFLHKLFPGYVNTGYRSLEKGFHLENALTHVFKASQITIKSLNDCSLESLFCSEKITTRFQSEEISKVHSEKIKRNPFKNEKSPQAFIFDIVKKVKFHENIQFCDDFDLLYGFSCQYRNLFDLFKTYSHKYMNCFDEIRVFKALSLNQLTINFLYQSVSCEIVCTGRESGTFVKQVVSELFSAFNESEYSISSNQSDSEEVLFVDNACRLDILKICKFCFENNITDVCTIYLDNLAKFLLKLDDWHELWAEQVELEIVEGKMKLLTPCIYPRTYTFDLSLSTLDNYIEDRFYSILWHIAGNIIFNVSCISTYQCTNSDRKNYCYRISYRSYEVPLSRNRVINIQHNIIGRALNKLLNVTVL